MAPKVFECDVLSVADESDKLKTDISTWLASVNQNRHNAVDEFVAYLTTRNDEITVVQNNGSWLQQRIDEAEKEIKTQNDAEKVAEQKNEGFNRQSTAILQEIENLRFDIQNQGKVLSGQESAYQIKAKETQNTMSGYVEEIKLFDTNLGISVKTPEGATATRWCFTLLSPVAPDREAWYDLHYSNATRTYKVSNCTPSIPHVEKYVEYFNKGRLSFGGFTCAMRTAFKRVIMEEY